MGASGIPSPPRSRGGIDGRVRDRRPPARDARGGVRRNPHPPRHRGPSLGRWRNPSVPTPRPRPHRDIAARPRPHEPAAGTWHRAAPVHRPNPPGRASPRRASAPLDRRVAAAREPAGRRRARPSLRRSDQGREGQSSDGARARRGARPAARSRPSPRSSCPAAASLRPSGVLASRSPSSTGRVPGRAGGRGAGVDADRRSARGADRPAAALDLVPVLDRAQVAGILVPDESGYGFRHELYRSVVLETIAPGALAAMHLDTARTLIAWVRRRSTSQSTSPSVRNQVTTKRSIGCAGSRTRQPPVARHVATARRGRVPHSRPSRRSR